MTAPIASGWSESPGGPCTHWKAPPFHGARRFRPFTGALIDAPELTLKKTSVFSPVDDWAAEEANIAPAAGLLGAARGCATVRSRSSATPPCQSRSSHPNPFGEVL